MAKPQPTSKARAKPKALANSSGTAYAVGITLFCIVLGFVLLWSRLNIAHKVRPTVAYASFGPVVTRVRGYAFSATMAVQTSAADAKWAAQNKAAISEVLQTTLAKVDPNVLRAPGGLAALQETLKLAANAALRPGQVQDVLLTDFILQEDDD